VNLDQQIRAATIAINALAAGAERVHMASELATLEADVRHTVAKKYDWPGMPSNMTGYWYLFSRVTQARPKACCRQP